MTLNKLNESYDEYVLTEEYYLQEGLKFFKKSKRLKKYANKINKKVAKKEGKKRISPAQLNTLKTLSKNLTKLSDEYAVIEKDFASGNVNKKISKEKLKSADRNNKAILAKLKSKEVAGVFKAIGLGALVVGLGVVLFQVGMTPQMTSVLTKGFEDVSGRALAMKDAAAASLKTSASKIAEFKSGFEAVEAPGVPASASDISGLSSAESKLKAATKAAKNSGRADVAGLAKATADRSSAAELASKVSTASRTRAVRDAETAATTAARSVGAADYATTRAARTTILKRGEARTSRASRALAAARATRNRNRGL